MNDIADTNWSKADDKVSRVRSGSDGEWRCLVCKGTATPEYGHHMDCPKAKEYDFRKKTATAKRFEQWARGRAAYWLSELQKTQAKLEQVKAENRKLRKRIPNL